MRVLMLCGLAAAAVVMAGGAQAQTATAPPANPDQGTTPPTPKAGQDDTLKSLNLGLALGVSWNVGSNRVTDASVVNGVVRVSEDSNTSIAIVGEGHYFFHPGGSFLGLDAGHWGVGPFFSAEVNQSSLKSFGVGVMLGLKPTTTDGRAFTIGLGANWTPDTQVLGDGIFANKPLPAGETEVRFKKTTTTAVMLVVGTTF